MNTYCPGDLVHLVAVLSDSQTHAILQPSGVVAEVRDPSGALTTPPVYAETDAHGNGLFAADADTTDIEPGEWWYRFSVVNGLWAPPGVAQAVLYQGAEEGTFQVTESAFS